MNAAPTDPYHEENYPTLPSLKMGICYICDKPLTGKVDGDHIIPDHFFRKTDECRPQLPVHHDCNNAKSRDDKFAVLELQTLCSLNPEAEAGLVSFLKLAEAEKPYAHLIGQRHKVRNLRLALTMFEHIQEGLDLPVQGKDIKSFRNAPKTADRINAYVGQLCKGLYVRNVADASPGLPTKMTWINYEHAKLHGSYEKALGPIINIVNTGTASRFTQQWPGRVLYFGSRVAENRDKGYIFIEFYESLGILARFGDA